MNERGKLKMREQKEMLVEKLEANVSHAPLYQDEVAEDELSDFEEGAKEYLAMVLIFGNIRSGNNGANLYQEFRVDYYSENRDDVDEVTLDIISSVASVKTVVFKDTLRQRYRVKETDRFIDVVSVIFRRAVAYEC